MQIVTWAFTFGTSCGVQGGSCKLALDRLEVLLDGIGLKKAEAIGIYRKEHGAFNSLEDLQMVKGIGAKKLEKNKSEIRF